MGLLRFNRRRETPEERLAFFINENYGTFMEEMTESFVLHHDYGWSAPWIAARREEKLGFTRQSVDEDAPYSAEIEVLKEIATGERTMGKGNHHFETEVTAQRVFLFFLFLELEPGHREEAITQADRIGDLVDDFWLPQIAEVLEWNQHQLLEARRLLRGGSE